MIARSAGATAAKRERQFGVFHPKRMLSFWLDAETVRDECREACTLYCLDDFRAEMSLPVSTTSVFTPIRKYSNTKRRMRPSSPDAQLGLLFGGKIMASRALIESRSAQGE
jgi:hypothetical protein